MYGIRIKLIRTITMKSIPVNPVSIAFILLFFMVSIFSCNTNEVTNDTVASDSSANSVIRKETAMPNEPLKVAVAATDSVTPNAKSSTKDSIGSKISIHHGEVKVVDTAKGEN